ncbi:MAG: SPOR domain-containing protein [Sphingomonas sp.]|nr:SPOR domain-containing protein [Sphingomonas sp.]
MRRTRWILASSLMASALAGLPLRAQTGEVVQATPSAEAVASLNRNLALLSRNPQDVNALLGAGQAALDLGDVQAANGFFTRANMVNPRLGKAKLGLAVVQIALKQPVEAAANFDAAAALGEQAQGHLADRALAYDLTGQQEKAQADYQAALRLNPSDATARMRYAVSLGVSGKVAEAERQLEPALSSSDREAWRMRAFVLAMNGRIADARKITSTMMPKGLADALDPYMQRLPLLTAGQKAAATHFGEFPANVLRLAAPEPAREVQVAANTTERSNSRRDRNSRSSNDRRANSRETSNRQASATPTASAPASASFPPARRELTPPPPPSSTSGQQLAANTASPPPRPAAVAPSRSASPQQAQSQSSASRVPSAAPADQPPARAAAQPSRASFEAPATVQTASAEVEAPRRPSVTPVGAAQGPFDPQATTQATRAATPSVSSPAASTPVVSAPSQSVAQIPPRSLADTLSSLDVPDQEKQSGAAVADLRAVARIQEQRRKAAEAAAAKAKADAEAKAKAEAAKKAEAERKAKLAANPSRNWVQVATGRDVDALAFDMRRLRRTYADAIGDQSGWTAQWGATRRLLIGPFKKPEDAKATVAKIAKSGGDAFLWQSEAGEEVVKLGGK